MRILAYAESLQLWANQPTVALSGFAGIRTWPSAFFLGLIWHGPIGDDLSWFRKVALPWLNPVCIDQWYVQKCYRRFRVLQHSIGVGMGQKQWPHATLPAKMNDDFVEQDWP